MITRIFPQTAEEWQSKLSMDIGGFIGWLLNPYIWFVWPPLRWCAATAGMAAQESGFKWDAVGDDGKAVGILQFHEDSVTLPWPIKDKGGPGDWRLSPFWSGWGAAIYTANLLGHSPWWWFQAVPEFGFAMLRWSWTHQTSETSAREGLTKAWPAFQAEEIAFPAWHAWRGITFVPTGLVVMAAQAMRRG